MRAPRGRLLRRDGHMCLQETSASLCVGAVCANAYPSQPCYWASRAPFLQINLSFGPHLVTVSAAHWQAPAASALRAWGRRLAGTTGPSPRGYRKAAGNSLAAAQILQARQSDRMHFHHLLRPEGVRKLVWYGHMQLMLELLRGGRRERSIFLQAKSKSTVVKTAFFSAGRRQSHQARMDTGRRK